MSIVENIKSLCKQKGISIPKLEQELGFSKGSIYNWDKSSPSVDKVKKVADYFNKPLDSIFSMTDDSEYTLQIQKENEDFYEFEEHLYSRYTNRDFLTMLVNFFITEVSYLDRENNLLRFLPQYQKRFKEALDKIGDKYNVNFENTPESVETICKNSNNKEFTRQILETLKRIKLEVDNGIRFGKIPPPVPVEDIETIAAHHDGEDWTEEELQEIEQFKEFVRMKRKQKQQE